MCWVSYYFLIKPSRVLEVIASHGYSGKLKLLKQGTHNQPGTGFYTQPPLAAELGSCAASKGNGGDFTLPPLPHNFLLKFLF